MEKEYQLFKQILDKFKCTIEEAIFLFSGVILFNLNINEYNTKEELFNEILKMEFDPIDKLIKKLNLIEKLSEEEKALLLCFKYNKKRCSVEKIIRKTGFSIYKIKNILYSLRNKLIIYFDETFLLPELIILTPIGEKIVKELKNERNRSSN